MIILNNIYAIRTRKNLSLRKLAKLSGVTYSAINLIENGRAIPCQYSILRISKALNMPAHKVFMLGHTKITLD